MPLHCTTSSDGKAVLLWQKGRVVTNMRFERMDWLLTYCSRHDTVLHRLDGRCVTSTDVLTGGILTGYRAVS